MGKLNLLVFLNSYEDRHSSNAPSRSNFKWSRDVNGLPVENAQSDSFSLAPGESRTLFNGTRTLLQDGSTQYSTSLVAGTTNTYQLSWVGGTAPNFRTPRTTGADATTQVTVTVNGPLTTFTSTGGTPLALISGGVIVGDNVIIGSTFNAANQGTWKIVSLTATSFTVINQIGVAEGPYTLGASFASQIQIFSAAGVQVGDTLVISSGFSPVTQGSYVLTAVAAEYLQFFSANILPIEGPITTDLITIYSMAKQLVYAETDQNCSIQINGGSSSISFSPLSVDPFINACNAGLNNSGNPINPVISSPIIPSSPRPGIFMNTGVTYSLVITNNSPNIANIFVASAE